MVSSLEPDIDNVYKIEIKTTFDRGRCVIRIPKSILRFYHTKPTTTIDHMENGLERNNVVAEVELPLSKDSMNLITEEINNNLRKMPLLVYLKKVDQKKSQKDPE
tara:strand:+ start:638 stop:952 length:315 start_codon:yes stop_codon:yes gene_type:complete